MVLLAIMESFLYPLPSSLFISAMCVISFAAMTNGGISEIKGKHMQFSKFFNVGYSTNNQNKLLLAGRTGMFIAYIPAFLFALASLALLPDLGLRFALLRSALTLHFFKRIFEVVFIHKYSSWMELETAITISISYCTYTSTMIYAQYLTQGLQEPPIDLKYPGITLFLVGISGNFCHHYLLSRLRTNGDKQYKIPQGGLFRFVVCPHYLCEIIEFFGLSCVCQTSYLFCFTFGSMFYLMGRSVATRRWYQSKFDDFPKNIEALIPYIF